MVGADAGIDRIILKWILEKWLRRMCTGFIRLRMKIGENGKVHTDLIKNGEFIIS
jgi:hypothetical protein